MCQIASDKIKSTIGSLNLNRIRSRYIVLMRKNRPMSIEYGFAKTQNGQFYPPFLFIQAHFYRTFWQFHKLTFHFEVSNPVFAREIPHPFITEFHHSCVVSKKKRMGITNRIFKEQNNTMLTLFVLKNRWLCPMQTEDKKDDIWQ